jgi:hypothetical protein
MTIVHCLVLLTLAGLSGFGPQTYSHSASSETSSSPLGGAVTRGRRPTFNAMVPGRAAEASTETLGESPSGGDAGSAGILHRWRQLSRSRRRP